jgi:hypothetical protein
LRYYVVSSSLKGIQERFLYGDLLAMGRRDGSGAWRALFRHPHVLPPTGIEVPDDGDGDVMTKATMCRNCGVIEIVGDVNKLRRLTAEPEPTTQQFARGNGRPASL